MAKIRRKCSKCNKGGHYAPTCKAKKKKIAKSTKKAVKKKAVKKKVAKKVTKKKVSKKAVKKKTIKRTTTTKGKGYSITGKGSGWKCFQFIGGTQKGNLSYKTWCVKVSGTSVTTRWGRTSGQKRETPKRYASNQQAYQAAQRLINSKVGKGYHYIGSKRKLG